jgi:thymidylate synthase (FAD)
MKIINEQWEIIGAEEFDYEYTLKKIESIGRTCYKSENNITEDSAEEFCRKLIKRGHEAMIEHHIESVRIVCDRGVSHELVRHRLASFAQESTRYCNYSQDKFGKEITVVNPTRHFKSSIASDIWSAAMYNAEQAYNKLIELGESPQMARSVLPNSLKTEIVVTANLREWRTIFKLRTPPTAHPQMRVIMNQLLMAFKTNLPVFFEDLEYDEILIDLA